MIVRLVCFTPATVCNLVLLVSRRAPGFVQLVWISVVVSYLLSSFLFNLMILELILFMLFFFYVGGVMGLLLVQWFCIQDFEFVLLYVVLYCVIVQVRLLFVMRLSVLSVRLMQLLVLVGLFWMSMQGLLLLRQMFIGQVFQCCFLFSRFQNCFVSWFRLIVCFLVVCLVCFCMFLVGGVLFVVLQMELGVVLLLVLYWLMIVFVVFLMVLVQVFFGMLFGLLICLMLWFLVVVWMFLKLQDELFGVLIGNM